MTRARLALIALLGIAGAAAFVHARRAPASPAQPAPLPDWVFAQPPLATADTFGYPALGVDKRVVLDLLRDRRYEELEQRLDSLQRLVARDIRFEYHLYEAYDAFQHENPSMEARLDAWLASSPGAVEPRLARAAYRLQMAWRSRGERAIGRTSEDQLRGMAAQLKLGLRELEQAMRIDSAQFTAYWIYLEIMQLAAGAEAARPLVDQALALYPDSYLLRMHYMTMLQPRWGGSYEEMDRFAAEAASRTSSNPRLAALAGASHAERGQTAHLARDFDAAIEHLSKAIEIAPERNYFVERAEAYAKAGRNLEALADLNAAWPQRPEGPYTLLHRARVLVGLSWVAPAEQRTPLLKMALADATLLAQTYSDMAEARQLLGVIRDEMERAEASR